MKFTPLDEKRHLNWPIHLWPLLSAQEGGNQDPAQDIPTLPASEGFRAQAVSWLA